MARPGLISPAARGTREQADSAAGISWRAAARGVATFARAEVGACANLSPPRKCGDRGTSGAIGMWPFFVSAPVRGLRGPRCFSVNHPERRGVTAVVIARVTPEIEVRHIVISVGFELLSNSAMTSSHPRIESGFSEAPRVGRSNNRRRWSGYCLGSRSARYGVREEGTLAVPIAEAWPRRPREADHAEPFLTRNHAAGSDGGRL